MTASAAGLGLVSPRGLSSLVSRPSEQVVVAVMGLNGRGAVLGRTFARTPNALVAYVCDVDAQVLAKAVTQVGEAQARAPKGLGDFRREIGRASCRESGQSREDGGCVDADQRQQAGACC